MLEFAVTVKSETVGRWVLAVDAVGDRFLVANDDKSLRWVDIGDCKLLKARNPELPLPVIAVQPQKDGLVRAGGPLQGKMNGR